MAQRVKRGIWPALALVLTAPLVAEYLLGDLPIKMLPALILLAPMYGGTSRDTVMGRPPGRSASFRLPTSTRARRRLRPIFVRPLRWRNPARRCR